MSGANGARDYRYRERWWRGFLAVPDLPAGARLVGLVLSTHARADGTRAVASVAMLAADIGAGESTVRRHLAWIVSSGWAERTARGGRDGSGRVHASEYALTISTAQQGEQLSPASTARSDERLITAPRPLNANASTAQLGVSTAHLSERPPSSSPRDTPYLPAERHLHVVGGGGPEEGTHDDLTRDMLVMALDVYREMRTVEPNVTFEEVLESLRECFRWIDPDTPEEEQDDADHAAHAAASLAVDLGLSDRLTTLDRRRLTRRMRSIPADQRQYAVLVASEDPPSPDVHSAVAFLLSRIERADPKYQRKEAT